MFAPQTQRPLSVPMKNTAPSLVSWSPDCARLPGAAAGRGAPAAQPGRRLRGADPGIRGRRSWKRAGFLCLPLAEMKICGFFL